MMDLRRLGLLACYAIVTVSAGIVNKAAVPARVTNHAELLEKSANGISPVPTAVPKPDLVGMELFKRTLGSDTCGYFGGIKSVTETCNQVGASCINIGSYRGCCNGPTLSCVSTFFTACIPYTDLTVSGRDGSCGPRQTCCSSNKYPECGTMLYSANDNLQNTFTMLACYAPNAGLTYGLQDDPPGVTTSTSTSPSSSSTSTTTSTPNPTPSSPPTQTPDNNNATPVGAVVGGVVGGVGGIALIVLAAVFYMRRRSRNTTNPPPPYNNPQPGPQMSQPQYSNSGVPSAYDPRYRYTPLPPGSYDTAGAEMNTGAFTTPSSHSPDPVKMAGGGAMGSHVTAYEVGGLNEAPSTVPVGMNPRAELMS